MGRDTRNAARREAEWLAGNGPQACIVCGRLFCRRKERVCSRDCLAKLQEGQERPPGGP